MPRKYLIVLFFMAFVGVRHALPLQGLTYAQQPPDPCPPECTIDTMEIVTWYPSPYNEYEELRLYPTQRDSGDCNNDKIGLMYYDHGGTPSFPDNDKMMICKGTLLGWQEVGGADFWKASTTVSSNIYTDKSVKFGSYSTAGRPTCNADTLGAVIFDTNKNNLYLCKLGGYWEPVGGYSYTQSFATPATYTFVVPNGITEIIIEAWSAGGGGGGGSGSNSGSTGGDGGSSSVGSLIFVSGGIGGSGDYSGPGGNGGTSSAPINISGQNGWSHGGGGAGGFGAGNGGGGGGGPSATGGGGGGGAYGKGTFNVTSGALYTIVVGGGGTGGAGGGCQGTGNECCCSTRGSSGGTGGNGKAIIYY